MYVIEQRGRDDGEVVFWELSTSVPRGPDGEPVEEGPIGPEGTREREVLGNVDTLDVLINFLKKRSAAPIRVTEVENAFEAAQKGAASADRRVRPRPAVSKQSSSVDYGRPTPSSGQSRPTPSKKFPVVPALLVIAAMIAVWWFFLR